jgi:hypothetical protein
VTLEQYASLADIVGVTLIIASVVYLARQVKLSAAMMAASASAERVQRDFDLTTAVSGDREFAQIWAKGRSELDSLDEVDRIRVQMFMRRVLVHWHNMYQLRRQKLLADADWNELKWLMQFFSSQQSLRETWEVFKPSFEPGYQNFVEERFSAGDIGIANT